MPSRKIKIRKSGRRKKPQKAKSRKTPTKTKSRKIRKSRSPKGKKLPPKGKKLPQRPRVLTMADLDADLSVSKPKKASLPNQKMTKAQVDMSEVIWNSEKAASLDDIKSNIRAAFKKLFARSMKSKRASGVRILAKKLFGSFVVDACVDHTKFCNDSNPVPASNMDHTGAAIPIKISRKINGQVKMCYYSGLKALDLIKIL